MLFQYQYHTYFDKELINVVQSDKNGSVIVTGELTIVGLPNEFF